MIRFDEFRTSRNMQEWPYSRKIWQQGSSRWSYSVFFQIQKKSFARILTTFRIEMNNFAQRFYYSAIGYIELSWRSNQPWFILEGTQNFRNKRMFPLRMVWSPWENAEYRTSPYDVFYSELRSRNPLEAQYLDYLNLLKSGLTTEQAVIKLKLSKPTLLGMRIINTFNKFESRKKKRSFKDFLRWCNEKDGVPTLEAMQKMIAFDHDKDIDLLKLGCT